MKMKSVLFSLLFTTQIFFFSFAQQMPLVYDVENTGADVPKPPLPTVSQLPTITSLPDPFMWSDTRGRIENFSDWRYRRAEIGYEIQNYEIGTKPPRPDTIEASYADSVLTVIVTENGKTLTLTSRVILPEGPGPFPAVIGMNSPSGSIPGTIFSDRKIARITFNHNQVTTYGSFSNNDPYFKLYPQYNNTNIGQYSAWAWGISRLIDGLELVKNTLPIDTKHLCVTGCSYAGKMAIFAGAFDERIALTIGQESGGGGYTTWRVSETLGNVETLGRTDYNWFKDNMRDFASSVSKLPEDHHELMAMVAPRALLVTGNPDYVWLADESGHVGSKAAKKVWEALGVPDRFGYSIMAGHTHCAVPNSQIPEIAAFVDKFLLGKDTVNTNIATTPYTTNLTSWIPWNTPVLGNGTSYFGYTSLVSPADKEVDLPTSVTFKWNKHPEAAEYIIQLSLDATFSNPAFTDSTTDTTKTLSGLVKGKNYFWRVLVKNAQGLTGRSSELWTFKTFVSLPAAPVLASAKGVPGRSGYMKLTWNSSEYTDMYFIQVAKTDAFTSYSPGSTADTTKTFTGLTEGQLYYWRVQSQNIAGYGPWSTASSFTLINAPLDLTLTRGETSIVLSWTDKSSVEEGYVIERKQSPETSFTVIDTVKGASGYTDNNITQANYTYRVKAYLDTVVSEYSNEAVLSTLGIEEETGMPKAYSISQNYPNPFNPATKIKFALPQAGITKITIYNLLGREIQTVVNKEMEAGYHEINFDAASLPSGVYFYRIQSGNFIQTKKMTLMR